MLTGTMILWGSAIALMALLLWRPVVQYLRGKRYEHRLRDVRNELHAHPSQQDKDKTLNYLLHFYQLTLPDPYVTKPGYDEKRCYHCHHETGHAHLCPWATVRPLVAKLYPTPHGTVPK